MPLHTRTHARTHAHTRTHPDPPPPVRPSCVQLHQVHPMQTPQPPARTCQCTSHDRYAGRAACGRAAPPPDPPCTPCTGHRWWRRSCSGQEPGGQGRRQQGTGSGHFHGALFFVPVFPPPGCSAHRRCITHTPQKAVRQLHNRKTLRSGATCDPHPVAGPDCGPRHHLKPLHPFATPS